VSSCSWTCWFECMVEIYG